MKRIISILLVLLILFTLTAGAVASAPPFPDITDPQTALDAAVLQMLGVIEGFGGKFMPNGTLTRAAFCKMAVIMLGRGGQEAQYRSRTIFPDVRSDHWARGYINLAASAGIIAGNSDGTFKPDSDITYAQAVTILLRMLGYDESVIGMLWPSDHLLFASDIGLTDGLSVTPNSPIPRSQAARLFTNLLVTNLSGDGGIPFYSTLGTAVEDVIITNLDAEASDGSFGNIAVIGSENVYKSKTGIVPDVFLGLRGKLITSASGQVVTFLPSVSKSVTFIASSANAMWIKDSAGKQYDFKPDTVIYMPDGASGLLKDVFIDIAGQKITLYYKNDKIDTVFMESQQSESAFIVTSDTVSAALLSELTGGDSVYTVFRNGVEASLSDIRKYDVITYNKPSRILSVSDFRITAGLEYVWPNPEHPAQVSFLNSEPFDVLPSAVSSLSAYRPGDVLTFLLTSDLKVAGVFNPKVLFASPVGIATNVTTSSASVTLINAMTFAGKTKLTEYQANQLNGALVTLSSDGDGSMIITKVGGSGGYGSAADLNTMTCGNLKISPHVRIFDKAGTSAVSPVPLSELMQGKIPASKILYLGTDSGGLIDLIILNDMTGDVYEYGFLKLSFEPVSTLSGSDVLQRSVSVRNSVYPDGSPLYASSQEFKNGDAGGVAVSAGGGEASALVTLTSADNLRRSDFKTVGGRVYASVGSVSIPVSDNVQCYNKATGRWFDSLADARTYSDNLTVYYDRPASENGKIRLVVAQ